MARVLIVDDSRFFRKSLGKVVSQDHDVVAFAEDGFDAIYKYRTYQPEIVLLDITMPNKDGKACLKDLLSEDPNAKVIIVSALSSKDIVDECLNLGAYDFIPKDQVLKPDNFVAKKIREVMGA